MRVLKTIAKVSAISVLGLALLLVLAVVAVVILVDPNDFKAEISRQVKESTGRELKLEGDLGLSFFPWLALEVHKAQLGNAPGFGDEPFAAIEEAEIGVRLWPLLNKDLQVGTVRLRGLRLNLEIDGTGKSNWEDLGSEEEDTGDSGGPEKASIAGLLIKDAAVSYEDRQAGSRIAITALNVETSRLTPGQPMDVKLSANVATEEGGKPLPVELAIPALTVDLDAQTLRAPEFLLGLTPAKIRGQLNGEKILDAPAFSGRITLEPVSPRELFRTLDIEAPQTADAGALKSVQLEAAVAANADSVMLSDMKMKLDDTSMTGSLGVADFETTALRFALVVDSINLDRYLPPAEPEAAGAKEAAAAEPVELPLEIIKSLNAEGSLDIASMTFAGMKLSAVKLQLNAKDGLVRLDPSQAQLFNGTHRGKFTVDARGAVAKVAMEETLSGIDFAPLMQDLFESQRLAGKGSANMTLAASGNDSTAWMRTLNGKIDFSVAEGAVQGMDLWHEIRRAESLLKQRPYAGASAGRTAFKSLKGSATVKDGMVDNRDLDVDMDYLKVAGQGSLALPTRKVDYQLKSTVYRVPADASTELASLKSLEIPVKISGTLDDLKVRPDLEAKLKSEVKQKLEEKKEVLKEKLGEKLNDLFKRRSKDQ